jgi:outer membrane biosynthesis protein TonB
VYVALMVNFEDILKQPPEQAPAQTMEFVLAPPIPEPVATPEPIEPDKPPPPKHMEDDINKANTSDGIAETGGKQTPKPKGQDTPELSEAEAESTADSPELLSSSLSDLLQQAINNVELEKATDSDDKKQMGEQLEELDDSALDDSLVESPLNKLEEEKARWRNMVLKRISEQIKFVWVKPDGTRQSDSGIIRLDIDREGYLKGAWVHLPSGDGMLDASVLRAIRSVWHFQIPKSDRLNRYYRHLEFHYSGGRETG